MQKLQYKTFAQIVPFCSFLLMILAIVHWWHLTVNMNYLVFYVVLYDIDFVGFWMLPADWCAFKIIHHQEDPNRQVSGCFHVATRHSISLNQCKEWACSVKANCINYHLMEGGCNAKRCNGDDPMLEPHDYNYDVLFRIWYAIVIIPYLHDYCFSQNRSTLDLQSVYGRLCKCICWHINAETAKWSVLN